MTNVPLMLGAGVWLLLTFSAAAFGARFGPDEWYRQLAKPAWTPPNAIFAPVWTILYLLMATAAWLVWKRQGVAGAVVPLALFIFQLALNAAWSWLFFGRHRPQAAFVDIVVLWAVAATLISFIEGPASAIFRAHAALSTGFPLSSDPAPRSGGRAPSRIAVRPRWSDLVVGVAFSRSAP